MPWHAQGHRSSEEEEDDPSAQRKKNQEILLFREHEEQLSLTLRLSTQRNLELSNHLNLAQDQLIVKDQDISRLT